MAGKSKGRLIGELIREFRVSGNQDDTFDSLAAGRLGVSETDLRCLNIIENAGGLSAGDLAAQSGLTGGAITGVIDRLEKVGFARRVVDPSDRRRVLVEVTPAFYKATESIWGPVAADWQTALSKHFTKDELERIFDFLRITNEVGRRHIERLARGPRKPRATPTTPTKERCAWGSGSDD
jgi:DNA-binding MarR family transcriptional regulator